MQNIILKQYLTYYENLLFKDTIHFKKLFIKKLKIPFTPRPGHVIDEIKCSKCRYNSKTDTWTISSGYIHDCDNLNDFKYHVNRLKENGFHEIEWKLEE